MRLHHRLLGLLLCLMLSIPMLGIASEETSTTPAYMATLTKNANLRSQPSTDALVKRYLVPGDQVTLLELSGDWYTVRFEDVIGYLRHDIVEASTLSPSVDVNGAEVEAYRTLGRGEKGLAVRLLQGALNALGYDAGEVDGMYGRKTAVAVAEFQGYQAMDVTGIADERTQRMLYSGNATPAPTPAYARPTLRLNSQAEEVAELQGWLINLGYLGGAPSGTYDKATEAAIKSFQRDEGLTADGITGPKTWERLDAFAAILEGA
ncbi:MAG TPA: peptidoglycan-binding protein [Clostridia bacterium]|nr:peptidoglycan-binding protein [Clostridia bacterium]